MSARAHTRAVAALPPRLQSPHASGVRMITHPLDEPRPVLADVSLRAGCEGSYAGWSGEEVVWSSHTLPFVATYSEVRVLRCVGHPFGATLIGHIDWPH